jgi:hypothetical protein
VLVFKVICVQEVFYQLICSKYLKEVNKFLRPFGLSTPKGDMRGKRNHFSLASAM